jgi:hypothetical protein
MVLGVIFSPAIVGFISVILSLMARHAAVSDWRSLPDITFLLSITAVTGPFLASDKQLNDPTRFYLLGAAAVFGAVAIEGLQWVMPRRQSKRSN